MGDDDVVNEGYTQEFPGFYKPFRCLDILSTWGWVLGGVVVGDYEAARSILDCRREYFARMNY